MSFSVRLLFFVLLAGPLVAQAQVPAMPTVPAVLPTAFFATYQYRAYTVYDATTAEPPTEVMGVGGTLTLRPDSSYEKHFSLLLADGPHYFNQTGRFALRGDSIRFAFTDLKGADVQRGTFHYEPATQRLTLTILGYPPGNRGVYELGPPPPAVKPRPVPKAALSKRRAHR